VAGALVLSVVTVGQQIWRGFKPEQA